VTPAGTEAGRPRWVAALLLAATFAAGGVAGAAAMALADQDRRPAPAHEAGAPKAERPGHGEHGPDAYLDRLTRDLALTPAQRESVSAVLARHRPEMDSLMRATRPRIETLRATIRSEIRTHLTPEQRQRYDELRQRQHRGGTRDDTTARR